MGQLMFEREPDAKVTFHMTNRKALSGMRIADYIPPQELQERYDDLRELTFTPAEIDILHSQTDKRYSKEYLGFLATFHLPEIEVMIDPTDNDLTAETTAPWNGSSLWEIPMLSEIPKLYYPRYIKANGGTMAQVWNEGDRRLDDFIALIKANDIKWAEFGTRRRFSSEWQDHAVGRFVMECPEQFLGTSNPWLAHKYGVPAIGTNAHELPMVYDALEESRGGNPLSGQVKVIDDWLERFPTMPTLLVDTLTSDFTLRALTRSQLEAIKTCRIDSGDERVVGRKIIEFWQGQGLHAPNLMFTNSLSGEKAAMLKRFFGKSATTLFGIGGGSVNNMGFDSTHDLPGMNLVSKAVRANGYGTVKLSDDIGKNMGKPEDVRRYKKKITTWHSVNLEELQAVS